ncbi:MAG: hypothetical protein R6U96_06835 [Promethearchaeia archaeon]
MTSYYRGYILIRLRTIGKEWDIVDKLRGLKSTEEGEEWQVDYATPVYGGWDLIVECRFTKLQDLDKIVTYCRVDEDMGQWIEDTTTLMGSRADFTG